MTGLIDAEDRATAALRRELELTWQGHTREHEQHDKAHAREHQFTEEALKISADLARSNKADSNEWRGSMRDREATFATKVEHAALIDRVDKLERLSLVRDERERTLAIEVASDRAEADRRAARNQWIAGIVITFVVILVNYAIGQLGL